MSSGVATRYAKAIFSLAKEDKKLEVLGKDLSSLSDALKISEDLRNLISSPVYSRSQQELAIAAISKKMKLTDLMQNALGLMSSKRRLYILPNLIDEVNSYIAEDKGEIMVNVTSADELSEIQSKNLVKTLKNAIGKKQKLPKCV